MLLSPGQWGRGTKDAHRILTQEFYFCSRQYKQTDGSVFGEAGGDTMSTLRIVCAVCLTAVMFAAPAAAVERIPRGFLNASPAEHLLDAWAGKSLWVPEPPFLGGAVCFDLRAFDDCEIYQFDRQMNMTKKGGGSCGIREYIVVDSPGMQTDDYALIIGGIGMSCKHAFDHVISPAETAFKTRNGLTEFEIFDGPCSSRSK
jgi:hypothetical protein